MTRPGGVWKNWAGTQLVRPVRVERPATVDAVRRCVQAAASRGLRVKAVGAGHSFSAIAVAPGVLVDLSDLTGIVSVDQERRHVRVLAGTRLHQMPRLLAPFGLAMENLGDIDRQSVSGALSTGTHGTGARFGGLATQVVGVTLIRADGEMIEVTTEKNAELLPAVALSLGALGIIVDVTLACVPAFALHAVERSEPLVDTVTGFADRARAHDHVEFYWFPHTDRALTKTHTRVDIADAAPRPRVAAWMDDVAIGNGLHQAACSIGRGFPAMIPAINRLSTRVWGDRTFTDESHRVLTTPRRVKFREMEYAIALEDLEATFTDVRALIAARGWRVEFPIEVRVAAADEVWMSTANGRTSAYIAVHRYRGAPHEDYFAAIEHILMARQGRPHWGKMHTQTADTLRGRYRRFDDFVALRDAWDPHRMFGNPYLTSVLDE